MKNAISISLTISIFLIIISGSLYLYMIQPQDAVVSPIPSSITQDAIIIPAKRIYNPTHTDITVQEYDVRGVSMQPMIQNGDKIIVDLNYYNGGQHKVTTGDVVVFENPFTLNRIIKRVGIVPGDKIHKDLKQRTLLINGKILKNSVGVTYTFTDLAYKWIDIYTKSGVIMDNTYYLYGDNVSGSLDSRNTGPVTLEGILGKVVGK